MTSELPIGYAFSRGNAPDEPIYRIRMEVSLWVSGEGALRIVRRDHEPRYLCLGATEFDRLMEMRRLAIRATSRREQGRQLPGMRAQAVLLYAPVAPEDSDRKNHLYYTAVSRSAPAPEPSLRRLIAYMHTLFEKRHDRARPLNGNRERCPAPQG